MCTLSTPRKQAQSLSETSPSLMAALMENMTAAQIRPNKEFLVSSSPSKTEKAEALLFTAAKRHCENEDYSGLQAIKSVTTKQASQHLEKDPKCATEWEILVKSTLGWLGASKEGSFVHIVPSLMAAILDSGMTNKQLSSNANKEFAGSSATKVELVEAVIRTAAKRHCGSTEYEGLDALKALVISSARENLDEYEGCDSEWRRLIDQASSPDGVSTVFDFDAVHSDSTKKSLQFDVDTHADEDADSEEGGAAEGATAGKGCQATGAEGVKHLTSLAEFNQAIAGLVIVDFTATWCPPCKRIGPVFEQIAVENQGSSLSFVKVDVDENEEASEKADIDCMPTFQVWSGGRKLECVEGADESKLRELVAKHVGEAEAAKWPTMGMKLKELQTMAAERGVDADDNQAVVGNRGYKKTWIRAIVGTLSLRELKDMAAEIGVDADAVEGHKGHKKSWAGAIMGAM